MENLTPLGAENFGAHFEIGIIKVTEILATEASPIYYLQPQSLLEDQQWIEFCRNFGQLAGLKHVRAIMDNSQGFVATTIESIEVGMRMARDTGIETVVWAYVSSDRSFEMQSRMIETVYAKFNIRARSQTFETLEEAVAWTNGLIAEQGF